MKQANQREHAEAFRRLHREGGILVLPNAWDVITARVIESAGFAAIATSSAGVAWALGYADGERISRGEMLAVVRRIASSASVPVTADMEAGYGPTPEAAAETARGVIAAGAVGLNLEDGTNDGRLVDVGLQQDRIRAMREAGAAAGVHQATVVGPVLEVQPHGARRDDAARSLGRGFRGRPVPRFHVGGHRHT